MCSRTLFNSDSSLSVTDSMTPNLVRDFDCGRCKTPPFLLRCIVKSPTAILYISAVGVWYFENPTNSEQFPDIFHSMWWAVVTLTTVGYGTGALLGRGVKKVRNLYWKKELGLAQAMWLIDVENFGPFIAESDVLGNSLFERENKKISQKITKAYEGTRPAVLKRFGETSNPEDDLI